jgi:hypothetical protein
VNTKLEMKELLGRYVIPATTVYQGKTVRQFPAGWVTDDTPYAIIRGGYLDDGNVLLLCESPKGLLFKTYIEMIQMVPENALPPEEPIPHSAWTGR